MCKRNLRYDVFMMGKKDNSQRAHLPVEQYRKSIGKSEYKRNKKELKRVKGTAEARKSSTGYRDSFLVLMSVFAVFCIIYAILYFQISS
ncbi:putative triple QxxK/R motif-containing protein-like [Apostichopus japonicus]|uniref:Triple QxxK/R motif-containing protein n=1 Tax=Stichopus japonicus TaxID=307972 RepID=A0A2G8KKA1_STIJA|nr:putative triple QxxK/R motif-containing protein-like [Apostichopus japonicus]